MRRGSYVDAIEALRIAAEVTSNFFNSLSVDKTEDFDQKDFSVVLDNYYKNYSDLLNIKNIFINFDTIIKKILRERVVSNIDELRLLGTMLKETINEYISSNVSFVEKYCRDNLRNLNVLIVPPGSIVSRCVNRVKGKVYLVATRLMANNIIYTKSLNNAILVPEAYIQGIVRDDVDAIIVQADSVFQQGIYSPPGSLAAVKVGREEDLEVIALSIGMVVRSTRLPDLILGLKESMHVMMEWGEEISVYSNDAISINNIDKLVLGLNGIIDVGKVKSIGSSLLKVNKEHVDYVFKSLLEKGKTRQ